MKNCCDCKHLREENNINIEDCVKNNYKYFEKTEVTNGNSYFKLDNRKNKKNHSSNDK